MTKMPPFAVALSLCLAFAAGTGPAADAPDKIDGQYDAAVYEHGDYGGLSQYLVEGEYNLDALSIGNDVISSVRVAPGYEVVLYRHIDFGGRLISITRDAPELPTFNDETSSIRVRIFDPDREPEEAKAELSEFLGVWENDAEYRVVAVDDATVAIHSRDGASRSSYETTEEGLKIYNRGTLLRNADGTLSMPGVEGVFHRAGGGMGVDPFAEYRPYLGDWSCEENGLRITVARGAASYRTSTDEVGFAMAAVDGDGRLRLGDSTGEIDAEAGNLVFGDGEYAGVYVKNP